MAHGNYGPATEATAGDYVNIPDGVYEYFVVDLEEIPNTFWKEGDSEKSKWRLKWTFQLRPSEVDDLPALTDADKQYGRKAWWRTGTSISKDKRAYLTPTFLGYLDDDYKEDVGYLSFDHMKQSVMYSPIRLMVKENDKGWLDVKGVLGTKLGKMTDAEFVYAGMADAITKP